MFTLTAVNFENANGYLWVRLDSFYEQQERYRKYGVLHIFYIKNCLLNACFVSICKNGVAL